MCVCFSSFLAFSRNGFAGPAHNSTSPRCFHKMSAMLSLVRAIDSFAVCLVVAHPLYHMLILSVFAAHVRSSKPYRPCRRTVSHQPPTTNQGRTWFSSRRFYTQLTSVAIPAVSSRQRWCCHLKYRTRTFTIATVYLRPLCLFRKSSMA